jgi:hypothetical protein
MIVAFEICSSECGGLSLLMPEQAAKGQDGLRLFAARFRDLWW